MNALETITAFLGWCTVINIGLLVLAAIMLTVMRSTVIKIHASLFGLHDEDLANAYFQYLAHYKIAIFIFNLVPYLALRIIA